VSAAYRFFGKALATVVVGIAAAVAASMLGSLTGGSPDFMAGAAWMTVFYAFWPTMVVGAR
jgi:L-serine deaminase